MCPKATKWQGIFWEPGKRMDHIILEWEPQQVCAYLDGLPAEDPVFLVGGACADLGRNGHIDKATALMTAAKAHWPQFRWEGVEEWVKLVVENSPPVCDHPVPQDAKVTLYAFLELKSARARGNLPSPPN